MNSVSIIGRLTQDPTSKTVGDNLKVCDFNLAFDKRKKDAGTNFIDCSAWNSTATYIQEYAKKGQQIAIQGFLDQQVWEKDGKRNYKWQVVVNEAKLIGGGSGEKKEEASQDVVDLSSIPFN